MKTTLLALAALIATAAGPAATAATTVTTTVTTAATTAAQVPARQPLSSYVLENPDAETLQKIARYFEIEGRENTQYRILVPQSQAGLLQLLAPRAELRELDTAAALRAQLAVYEQNARDLPWPWPTPPREGYRDYDGVLAWMKSTAAAHAAIASVVDYGESGAKRPLRALRLFNDDGRANKPALLLTAATHGDEVITTEVLIRLTDQLLSQYGKDVRFTRMIDDHDLYIVPVVNADGFAERDRYDFGQDPNRSYPYPNEPARAPTPSIKAMIEFYEGRKFAGNIDLHAYGEMVMYPWAYTYDPIAADAQAKLDGITRRMAETNGYAQGPISKVIYVAPGSSCDYYFWKTGAVSVAIEIGRSKAPSPSQIPAYANSQAESTWRFIESF